MPYADPEKKKAYNRKYAAENKEKLAEYGRQWRVQNADWVEEYLAQPEVKQRNQASWKKSGEKRKQKGRKEESRRYYVNNTEKIKANVKEYQKNNPEKVKLSRAARRSLRGKCTEQQIRDRVEFFGSICVYCGKPWSWDNTNDHLDHTIAVKRGGTKWPANFRPACASCNHKKHAEDWRKWPPII